MEITREVIQVPAVMFDLLKTGIGFIL